MSCCFYACARSCPTVQATVHLVRSVRLVCSATNEHTEVKEMRKLIVTNMMSLDGYYEGPGKDVMALFSYRQKAYPTDQSFDVYNAERLRSADTLLLGRV